MLGVLSAMKIAVCPGSFDPVTKGHVDVIRRASGMFDNVIVAVMNNSAKRCLFSAQERAQMLEKALAGVANARVEVFTGLLADFASRRGATAIVKGLRAMSDFEYEFQMALINRSLNNGTETVFLPGSAEYMYLSSSMVKEIARYGGDITAYVPDGLAAVIEKKIQGERNGDQHVGV